MPLAIYEEANIALQPRGFLFRLQAPGCVIFLFNHSNGATSRSQVERFSRLIALHRNVRAAFSTYTYDRIPTPKLRDAAYFIFSL